MRPTSLATIAVLTFFTAGCATTGQVGTATPASTKSQITILYDAFGKSPAMKKDWGFAALVEVGGKRILFDTGDNPEIFAENVKAAGVDLRKLDFVVMSHRHGDHMGGFAHLLSVNPRVKIYAPKENFGVYGFSLPSSFYRKDESLPPEQRYYDGAPPQVMKFGSAWPGANFELIDKTTEVAPGVWLIALVSDAPGTKELKELSLAMDTPEGTVLVVACSHPGIEAVVEATSKVIPKRIHFIAGGFHLVVAQDDVIAKVAASLRDSWRVDAIAPGHCTGEPTFSALRRLFGSRYLYAGLGTVLSVGAEVSSTAALRGEAATLAGDDLDSYRQLAQRSDDAGQPVMADSGPLHGG
jgi:7,8-dihydropterin-6-yl-methyl-4-(beta-D-ribofuranosyl)aminobenzene 5'-phosphate synthase